MKNFFAWLGKNVDPLLAVLVALVIGVLEVVSNLDPTTLSNGVLLVLGVLSVALLRDRIRTEEADREIRAELRRSAEVRPALTALQEQVRQVERVLDDGSMVRVLSGPEVTRALEDARRSTDRWIFRGGTGTYIRAVTLPECVANARRERRTLQVRLEILDPTDEDLCTRYVSFRHSLGGDESAWTVERTQRESLATIVAACWHRQRYELLDIQVGLSSVMPTLRWDLSSARLLVTQESPNMPALMIEHGKLLFLYMQTELAKSFEQARLVPLEAARHTALGDPPTVDEIRKLFVTLNMPLPSTVTDRDVLDIAERALRARNPYKL